MKSPLNKIFDHEGPLTRQQLEDYLSGKLQGEERLHVERMLAEDELSAEAMEGLENDPDALNVLPLAFTAATGNTPVKSGNTYRSLFWSSTAVAVISVSVAIYFSHENKKILAEQQKSEQSVATVFTSDNITDNENQTAEIEEIDNATPIAQQEQITYRKTIADQPKTIIEEPRTEEIIIQENNNPEPVDLKKAQIIEESAPEVKTARSNVKFTYIHDLKVVDYSGLYTSGIRKTERNVNSGVAANLENSGTVDEMEPEIRVVYIPYEKYLEECLGDFTRNDFKTALKKFKIILQHYPEDLNAFFYGGLCYYNIGKSEKAIGFFDHCINNSFSTFEEEAQWYKAICLLQNRHTADGEKLLKEIVRQKGFYAERAAAKLKEIH